MPSFMMEIDAARRSPLDQLAVDYVHFQQAGSSIDFCRRACGVPEGDEVIARRLSVAVSTVRGWREIGRRAGQGGWRCQ
jgi:DNA-binding transcriptional regulator YiaG